jgi:hypothetical protein
MDHLAIRPDDPTDPTFSEADPDGRMHNRSRRHGAPDHFFDRSTFIAISTSIRSACSFFSLAVSSFGPVSRFACDIVIPPDLAFRRKKVPSNIPSQVTRSERPVFAFIPDRSNAHQRE